MTPLLDSLFPEIGSKRFLAEHWPEELAVAHAQRERLHFLDDLPELSSDRAYREFVTTTDASVLLYFGAQTDESSAFRISAAELPSLYRDAAMFSVGGAEAFSPALGVAMMQLKAELGLRSMSLARSIVYGAKPGMGAVWHWDAGANIVVQLAGHKRWKVAENTIVPQPPDRFAMTMTAWSDRLARCGVTGLPTPPEVFRVVDLYPGSVLFIPAGWWHSTETLDTSLAVNFTYGQPDYVRVLCRYLSNRLREDPRWRKLAQPDRDSCNFDELIQELSGLLSECRAADVYLALDD